MLWNESKLPSRPRQSGLRRDNERSRSRSRRWQQVAIRPGLLDLRNAAPRSRLEIERHRSFQKQSRNVRFVSSPLSNMNHVDLMKFSPSQSLRAFPGTTVASSHPHTHGNQSTGWPPLSPSFSPVLHPYYTHFPLMLEHITAHEGQSGLVKPLLE
ncbi:hypothetical protein SKAU_G00334310 [Synaphobranchus kaupii]|uniref:Uncharacterized protein n=1 Tax=Synaphobranchus kaupii TaxID=118154 RepID=A0A9Q1ELX5_SYNKA|nr:hypothetical protein SKAU_G00334310 [Synaphobranchus kaupii]